MEHHYEIGQSDRHAVKRIIEYLHYCESLIKYLHSEPAVAEIKKLIIFILIDRIIESFRWIMK